MFVSHLITLVFNLTAISHMEIQIRHDCRSCSFTTFSIHGLQSILVQWGFSQDLTPLALLPFWCTTMAEQADALVSAREDSDVGKSESKTKGNKVACNISGLALIWDNTSCIRQKLRDGNNLLQNYDPKLKMCTNHEVEKTIKNVRVNMSVLKPVCSLTRTHGLLPCIDTLVEEVKTAFRLNKAIVGISTAQKQGWAIRNLIAVLKGSVKARRVTDKSGLKQKVWTWPKDQSCKILWSKLWYVCMFCFFFASIDFSKRLHSNVLMGSST